MSIDKSANSYIFIENKQLMIMHAFQAVCDFQLAPRPSAV